MEETDPEPPQNRPFLRNRLNPASLSGIRYGYHRDRFVQDREEHTIEHEALTNELLKELLDSSDVGTFVRDHPSKPLNLSYFLADLLEEKGLRKSDVIRRSLLNETFAYQLFSGDRRCTRDKALQLAFAFPLSLDETDHLLLYAGASELYCRNRRDAIIIFCLTHHYTLSQTDDKLFEHGEATITKG